MPERHDVAQTILDLIELGAPIKRSTILKALKIGISTKAAKVVDGIVQDLQGSGLLEGDARKGMTVPKGAVAGLRTMLITEEEWVAEAKALIEGLGHHLADHIDLERELNEQPTGSDDPDSPGSTTNVSSCVASIVTVRPAIANP